jgi:hypothetical protein
MLLRVSVGKISTGSKIAKKDAKIIDANLTNFCFFKNNQIKTPVTAITN